MLDLSWLWRLVSVVARDAANERAPEPPLPNIIPKHLEFDEDGWAINDRVIRIPSRSGWYYRKLRTRDGLPTGITHHYTATNAGTAMTLALRRRDRKRSSWPRGKRPGSWHFTVAQNGDIIQQLSIRQGGFHAGSATARRLPIGWANFVTASIEWEGRGDVWTEEQIESGIWLMRGLIRTCDIEPTNAFHKHSWIDPTRKADPGPLFEEMVEPRLLEACYPRMHEAIRV